VVALVWALPGLADACAVCFEASDENREAFTITTVFMTTLPLLMIGGVVSWFWRETVRRELSPPLEAAAVEEPKAPQIPEPSPS
jgi:hypothetical protein